MALVFINVRAIYSAYLYIVLVYLWFQFRFQLLCVNSANVAIVAAKYCDYYTIWKSLLTYCRV